MTFRRGLLLALLLAALLAFYYRQQIYVRDFRAHVTRNGVREDGAQVFTNPSGDVLLENDNPPMYITLLQHGLPVRAPAQLNCIHFFACFIPRNAATLPGTSSTASIRSMTPTGIQYRDDNGRDTVVTFH